MIKVKRIYDPPEAVDGFRYLVDRLWPRGIKKDALKIDVWLKDIAPSDTLRRWFGHDPEKWEEFCSRYFRELEGRNALWLPILAKAKNNNITLLFSAKDIKHNNAVALKEFLDMR